MDIDKLEKNIESFPYSAYTRYLLLSHYKKKGHIDFERVVKKTALYFNNTHWLHFQLSQLENDNNNNDGSNHFAVLTEDQIGNANTNKNSFEEKQKDFISLTKTQEVNALNSSEEPALDANQNNFEVVTHNEEVISGDEQPNKEYETTGPANNISTFEINNDVQNIFDNSQSIETYKEEDSQYKENVQEEAGRASAVKQVIENTKEDVIAFEPLHTVDYFASQGIKIPDEALTNDKLGIQMKSFTEWLRSMKKLHPGKLPQHNSLAENIIQSAAESSNINTEVLTEAMAEVLIKQDKREKAIEMYNKLSLINPSKSAYFAAKIESIKST